MSQTASLVLFALATSWAPSLFNFFQGGATVDPVEVAVVVAEHLGTRKQCVTDSLESCPECPVCSCPISYSGLIQLAFLLAIIVILFFSLALYAACRGLRGRSSSIPRSTPSASRGGYS